MEAIIIIVVATSFLFILSHYIFRTVSFFHDRKHYFPEMEKERWERFYDIEQKRFITERYHTRIRQHRQSGRWYEYHDVCVDNDGKIRKGQWRRTHNVEKQKTHQ